MHDQNEKVRISKKALSNLITEHYEVLEMYRRLQIGCGIAKEAAVPKRTELTKLDDAVGEVLVSLLEDEEQLDDAIQNHGAVSGALMESLREKTPKRQERIQRQDLPGMIPVTSQRLFEAIGKQGISNSKSLAGELRVVGGTICKQMPPLITLDVVKRQKKTPLVGKRNWEYAYELTTRGRYAYLDLLNVSPRVYDYSTSSERLKHHIATNIAAHSLQDFKPLGFYFGPDSECINMKSNYGVKTTIAPDTAGWWGTRMTFIEIESGNDYFYFSLTMKKYLLSDVRTLLVIPMSRSFLSNYVKMARNTCVEGEYSTEEPLEVFVITLQDLIDGHEPELIAERSRRPSLGQII